MEANWTLDNLEERVKAAKEANKDYLQECEKEYIKRCTYRNDRCVPTLAICGMGRAGKDTAGEYIDAITQGEISYPGSASWRGIRLIAHMVGVTPEEAYRDRHQHRDFMIKAFHAIRGYDYPLLVRMCLGAGDMVVGVRGKLELEEIKRENIINLAIWIDNNRVSADHTVEYGPDDCDLSISNHGSLLEFYSKLHRLVRVIYS